MPAHNTTGLIQSFFQSHYLPSVEACEVADVALVFGRFDPILATVMSDLWHLGKVPCFFVSGGVGKDSGPLKELKIPEAHFLASVALFLEVPASALFLDPVSTNGAENSRQMLNWLQHQNLSLRRVICLGHPTTLVRLHAAHQQIQQDEFPTLEIDYQLLPAAWPIEPDERLMVEECRRLRDWPAKGWSVPVSIPAAVLEVI